MILLSAIVAYLPVPNLPDHALGFVARVLPSDSKGLISRVLRDVVTPDPICFVIRDTRDLVGYFSRFCCSH
jgi:hypothetical protein